MWTVRQEQRTSTVQSRQAGQINALVAEYGALRASVLRRRQTNVRDLAACQEMIRFNEAIDQMVAESVRQFDSASQSGGFSLMCLHMTCVSH